ncbi:MAG: aspartate/glutamate racemase family protein [bacterium]|nr:aspartate/glutamate racemase family protein [bacterium]
MTQIIIIGGMGPQASLSLHDRLIKRASMKGAVNGNDFPLIIHFSLPIDDFISNSEKISAAIAMINQQLEKVLNDDSKIILACNTAHLLLDRLNIRKDQIISLIGTTSKSKTLTSASTVGLLASPTTIRENLYSVKLHNKKVITLSKTEQAITETVIRNIISGKQIDDDVVIDQIQKLFQMGADAVILGCTELSMLNADRRQNLNIIDPVEETIKMAFEQDDKI